MFSNQIQKSVTQSLNTRTRRHPLQGAQSIDVDVDNSLYQLGRLGKEPKNAKKRKNQLGNLSEDISIDVGYEHGSAEEDLIREEVETTNKDDTKKGEEKKTNESLEKDGGAAEKTGIVKTKIKIKTIKKEEKNTGKINKGKFKVFGSLSIDKTPKQLEESVKKDDLEVDLISRIKEKDKATILGKPSEIKAGDADKTKVKKGKLTKKSLFKSSDSNVTSNANIKDTTDVECNVMKLDGMKETMVETKEEVVESSIQVVKTVQTEAIVPFEFDDTNKMDIEPTETNMEEIEEAQTTRKRKDHSSDNDTITKKLIIETDKTNEKIKDNEKGNKTEIDINSAAALTEKPNDVMIRQNESSDADVNVQVKSIVADGTSVNKGSEMNSSPFSLKMDLSKKRDIKMTIPLSDATITVGEIHSIAQEGLTMANEGSKIETNDTTNSVDKMNMNITKGAMKDGEVIIKKPDQNDQRLKDAEVAEKDNEMNSSPFSLKMDLSKKRDIKMTIPLSDATMRVAEIHSIAQEGLTMENEGSKIETNDTTNNIDKMNMNITKGAMKDGEVIIKKTDQNDQRLKDAKDAEKDNEMNSSPFSLKMDLSKKRDIKMTIPLSDATMRVGEIHSTAQEGLRNVEEVIKTETKERTKNVNKVNMNITKKTMKDEEVVVKEPDLTGQQFELKSTQGVVKDSDMPSSPFALKMDLSKKRGLKMTIPMSGVATNVDVVQPIGDVNTIEDDGRKKKKTNDTIPLSANKPWSPEEKERILVTEKKLGGTVRVETKLEKQPFRLNTTLRSKSDKSVVKPLTATTLKYDEREKSPLRSKSFVLSKNTATVEDDVIVPKSVPDKNSDDVLKQLPLSPFSPKERKIENVEDDVIVPTSVSSSKSENVSDALKKLQTSPTTMNTKISNSDYKIQTPSAKGRNVTDSVDIIPQSAGSSETPPKEGDETAPSTSPNKRMWKSFKRPDRNKKEDDTVAIETADDIKKKFKERRGSLNIEIGAPKKENDMSTGKDSSSSSKWGVIQRSLTVDSGDNWLKSMEQVVDQVMQRRTWKNQTDKNTKNKMNKMLVKTKTAWKSYEAEPGQLDYDKYYKMKQKHKEMMKEKKREKSTETGPIDMDKYNGIEKPDEEKEILDTILREREKRAGEIKEKVIRQKSLREEEKEKIVDLANQFQPIVETLAEPVPFKPTEAEPAIDVHAEAQTSIDYTLKRDLSGTRIASIESVDVSDWYDKDEPVALPPETEGERGSAPTNIPAKDNGAKNEKVVTDEIKNVQQSSEQPKKSKLTAIEKSVRELPEKAKEKKESVKEEKVDGGKSPKQPLEQFKESKEEEENTKIAKSTIRISKKDDNLPPPILEEKTKVEEMKKTLTERKPVVVAKTESVKTLPEVPTEIKEPPKRKEVKKEAITKKEENIDNLPEKPQVIKKDAIEKETESPVKPVGMNLPKIEKKEMITKTPEGTVEKKDVRVKKEKKEVIPKSHEKPKENLQTKIEKKVPIAETPGKPKEKEKPIVQKTGVLKSSEKPEEGKQPVIEKKEKLPENLGEKRENITKKIANDKIVSEKSKESRVPIAYRKDKVDKVPVIPKETKEPIAEKKEKIDKLPEKHIEDKQPIVQKQEKSNEMSEHVKEKITSKPNKIVKKEKTPELPRRKEPVVANPGKMEKTPVTTGKVIEPVPDKKSKILTRQENITDKKETITDKTVSTDKKPFTTKQVKEPVIDNKQPSKVKPSGDIRMKNVKPTTEIPAKPTVVRQSTPEFNSQRNDEYISENEMKRKFFKTYGDDRRNSKPIVLEKDDIIDDNLSEQEWVDNMIGKVHSKIVDNASNSTRLANETWTLIASGTKLYDKKGSVSEKSNEHAVEKHFRTETNDEKAWILVARGMKKEVPKEESNQYHREHRGEIVPDNDIWYSIAQGSELYYKRQRSIKKLSRWTGENILKEEPRYKWDMDNMPIKTEEFIHFDKKTSTRE